jgi:AAA+ ATPase superfamily predicted ATPase
VLYHPANDNAELDLHHTDDPVYVPALKVFLTIGHFVLINDHAREGTIVGQILRSSSNTAVVSLFLPLYAEGTRQYLYHPSILPRPICHISCSDAMELVRVGLLATISLEDIIGLAFVFLAADVMEYIFHMEGMSDAFVTRFMFSYSSRSLNELNRANFTSFPEVLPEHQLKWCDCVGRTFLIRSMIFGKNYGVFFATMVKVKESFRRRLLRFAFLHSFRTICCISLHGKAPPAELSPFRRSRED